MNQSLTFLLLVLEQGGNFQQDHDHFVYGDNDDHFLQARRMITFEALVKNYAEGKRNVLRINAPGPAPILVAKLLLYTLPKKE